MTVKYLTIAGEADTSTAATQQLALGLGTAPGAAGLQIGTGGKFNVDGNGNILMVNNVPMSWPSAQGTAGQVLVNNGIGVLTWTSLSATIAGSGTTGKLPKFTGSTAIGDSIISEASGKIGIGTSGTPTSLFSVGASSQFQVDGTGSIVAAAGITSTGTITFSGLGTGFVKSTSGALSSAASISLTADVSGTLPIGNGGTGSSSQNFVDLTTGQTAGGVKTFSTGIVTSGFKLTAAPTAGFVLTSDATGIGAWAAPGGTIGGLTTGKLPKAASASSLTDSIISESGGSITIGGLGAGIGHLSSGGVLSSSAVVLTSEVSGVLPIGNGGTGSSSQNFVDLTTGQTVGGVKTFSTGIVTSGFKLTTGASAGFVLTSDATGVGTWTAAGGTIGGLTTGKIPKASSASSLADSVIVESSGNIGVNTATPGARLDVKGSAAGRVLIGENAGDSAYGMISLNGTSNVTDYNFTSSASDKNLYINRPTGNDIHFQYAADTVPHMIIKASGLVGIGTPAPLNELEVSREGTYSYIGVTTYSNTPIEAPGLALQRARGTRLVPLAPQNGDPLGQLEWDGYIAGTGFALGARIGAVATENWSSTNNRGTDVFISTALNGTATAAERLRITAAGNVGIGTATPASKLDVEGNVAIGAAYSGTTAAPTNGMIVEGRVGIGTTTPSRNLHVYSNVDGFTGGALVENISAGTSARALLSLTSNSGSGVFQMTSSGFSLGAGFELLVPDGTQLYSSSDASGGLALIAAEASAPIVFGTGGWATANERMRILSDGKVGIGTSTPDSPLTVEQTTTETAGGGVYTNAIRQTISPASASAGSFTTLYALQTVTGSQNVASLNSFSMQTLQTGTGTITDTEALVNNNLASNSGSATSTNVTGLVLRTQMIGSGTWNIGTNKTIWLKKPIQSSGTLAGTNLYGIYLEDFSSPGGTWTNKYSIYSEGGTNYLGGSLEVGGDVTATQNVTVQKRILGASAAVTAANDLTLGTANLNVVSGATQINAITTTGWTAGSQVTLKFSGAPTVKHNTAGGGSTAVMLLAGSVDLTAAADTILGLVYDGTSWHETFRKAA